MWNWRKCGIGGNVDLEEMWNWRKCATARSAWSVLKFKNLGQSVLQGKTIINR